MRGPSIKGIVIAAVAANVLRLVEQGKISREQLEVGLEKEELKLLETKIQPALWYSIHSYDRLDRLMADAEAGGDLEGYLRRNGLTMSRLVQQAGLYSQLQPAGGSAERSVTALSDWGVKRTLSLWHGMVNFSRARCRLESDDPPVFRIDVDEAEPMSPLLRVANAGFLEGVFGYLADAPVRVEIDENRRDHFVYRLRLPES